MTKPNKSCAVCGKGYRRAYAVSHSKHQTLRRLQPNLQPFHIPGSPIGQRVRACTQCIRTAMKRKVQTPST